jgi:hypothetical protein
VLEDLLDVKYSTALPESGSLPSATWFAECFFFGHSAKKLFAKCQIKNTGQKKTLGKEDALPSAKKTLGKGLLCRVQKNTRQRSCFVERFFTRQNNFSKHILKP